MKTSSLLTAALMAGLCLAACSSDDEVLEQQQPIELNGSVNATIPAFEFDEELTRVNYEVSPTEGFVPTWAEGDNLGIFAQVSGYGDQYRFPISEGAGTAQAVFDGGAYRLWDDTRYSAFYPFNPDNAYMYDQLKVNMAGQVQDGNAPLAHLAQFDYMYAVGDYPVDGKVNFEFSHIASFVRLQCEMPVAGSFVSACILSEGQDFTANATFDLKTTKTLTTSNTTHGISLGLKNVSTTGANQTLELYMMVAPVDLRNKTLTFYVEGANGVTYYATANGKNMKAGKAYNYALTMQPLGEVKDGHGYVDLGMTVDGKNVLWATRNVGASSFIANGDYYAWGETEPKATYSWDNYKWLDTANSTYEQHQFTKYGQGNLTSLELDLEDDAANKNWGGSWKMPNKAQFQALLDAEKYQWSSVQIAAPTGEIARLLKVSSVDTPSKCIFLPVAGCAINTTISSVGTDGYYLTNEIDKTNLENANRFYFSYFTFSSYHGLEVHPWYRYVGQTVRPVCLGD